MIRKVIRLTTHQTIFATGMGNLDKTLGEGSRYSGMEMNTSEYGVFVKYNGAEAIIPYANIVSMSLAPEAPKTSETPKAPVVKK